LTPGIKPFPVTVINFDGLDETIGVMALMPPRNVTEADPFIKGKPESKRLKVTLAEPPLI
jgi:hypothetical protein